MLPRIGSKFTGNTDIEKAQATSLIAAPLGTHAWNYKPDELVNQPLNVNVACNQS